MSDIFQYNVLLRNILSFISSVELLRLTSVNHRWRSLILSKFRQGIEQSLKFDRLIIFFEIIKRNYPKTTIDDDGLYDFVCSTPVLKMGIWISLFYSKKHSQLILMIRFVNGNQTFVELESPFFVALEDEEIINITKTCKQFHLSHTGDYVFHFINDISISFRFDVNTGINYRFYRVPTLVDNLISMNKKFTQNFKLCELCVKNDPIVVHTKFLEKYTKHSSINLFCNRWRKSNMAFYVYKTNGEKNTINFYCQLFQSPDHWNQKFQNIFSCTCFYHIVSPFFIIFIIIDYIID